MHYSKFLCALPVAHAAVMARDVNYVYTTAVVVNTVVVTAGTPSATAAPDSSNQGGYPGQHGHGKFHNNGDTPPAPPQQPPSQPQAQAQPQAQPQSQSQQPQSYPASSSSAAAPSASVASSSAGGSGDSGSGGCPKDSSGHTSPGVNGKPAKSMLDSTNYIRRLYNPNAACLQWSDSLAQASQNCANIASESDLRMNSEVVSDPNYGGEYFTGDLASTEFERSMFVMLCQSPGDSQLKGQCPGKVGEVGCSAGACTGHHDAIVDAKGTNKYVGAAANAGTKWMSCSFSSKES